jgi:acetone carboxylase gamma subunit
MYTSPRTDVFLLALIQAEGILTFVVNRGLINNMTRTVIRFRKRIAHVLCRLSVKHCTVLVLMNVIFQFNSKTTRFHTCLYELFHCFGVKEHNFEFCSRILAIRYVKERKDKHVDKIYPQKEMKMQKVMIYL